MKLGYHEGSDLVMIIEVKLDDYQTLRIWNVFLRCWTVTYVE